MGRQTQITIDMRCAVRNILRRIALSRYCHRCHLFVEMATAREAAARLQCVNVRNVYRAAESGRLHHASDRDGSLLICRNSLRQNAAAAEQLTYWRMR